MTTWLSPLFHCDRTMKTDDAKQIDILYHPLSTPCSGTLSGETATMKLFGIKNCDTVKKARRWLDDHQIAYQFHDFRTDGLDPSTIQRWLNDVSWEQLMNKRGTTWRKLDDPRKDQLDTAAAIELMVAHPTLIKRPVIEDNSGVWVGFNESDFQARYAK